MKRYRWELLEQIGTCVEHVQPDEAHDVLNQILGIFTDLRLGGLPVRKMRCAQVASFCICGAHRGGAASSEILEEHYEFLAKLSLLRTWKLVTKNMHDYVDELIGRVRYEHRSDMERIIRSIRRELETSLDSPVSLEEYARNAGVSAGHLSRCFVEIAGQPFRSERSRIRMEVARRLLIETSLKVSTVARRVGLQDPSQFILDFRKHLGVTPGEFRRLHHADEDSPDSE